ADILVCGFTGLSSSVSWVRAKYWGLESPQYPQTGMSALRGRAIGAAPFPIFRAHAQARIHRIYGRVLATAMHVLVIADEVVKRLRLPKLFTCPLQEFVRF